jgi:hypothetical protein
MRTLNYGRLINAVNLVNDAGIELECPKGVSIWVGRDTDERDPDGGQPAGGCYDTLEVSVFDENVIQYIPHDAQLRIIRNGEQMTITEREQCFGDTILYVIGV